MRKNLWSLFILTFAMVFTACSDDDDKIEFIGDELNGVYKGTLNIEVNDDPFGGEITQKVYITKAGENKIKMELKNFSIAGMGVLGDIAVNSIDVVKMGANNSFTGTEKITLKIVGECDVTVSGTINGSTLDMDIAVAVAVADGMKVDVKFNGNKMATDQSSEAKLMSFTFDMKNDTINTIITRQPYFDGMNIVFTVGKKDWFDNFDPATDEEIKALIPTLLISEKAAITPKTDAVVDFTKPVEYTITSEDGIYTTKYTVTCISKSQIISFKFGLGNEDFANIVRQPVFNGTNILFIVKDDVTDLKFTPDIEVADGSTITPEVGAEVDFTEPVVYTVTSEDGIETKYTVTAILNKMVTKYSFDAWYPAHVAYEEPSNVIGTSNQGAYFLGGYGYPGYNGDIVNVLKTTDAIAGNAARVVTFDSRSIANALVPAVTAGALFSGTFILDDIFNPLNCTKFGVKFDKEPLSFKGHYKYKSGADFIDGELAKQTGDTLDIKIIPNKKDLGSIVAVLYEVTDYDDVKQSLTGTNVNTGLINGVDVRVSIANVAVKETEEFTSFDVLFTDLPGKSYDAKKKYKLAFVCSSSKDGDKFQGAGGSTLIVDEFEFICK